MIRNQKPEQRKLVIWIAVGSIALIILFIILLVSLVKCAPTVQATAIPQDFAETAIALTLAVYPTDTPLPTNTPTNTPLPTSTSLPTNTPTLIPTATRIYIVPIQPTECTLDPQGTCVPGGAIITPVAIKGQCDCEGGNYTCKSFGTLVEAQTCYDWCRAQVCNYCVGLLEECDCDPWGLDASDGSINPEGLVCGNDDDHVN